MARLKNVSGEDLIVPGLDSRLVLAGQIVEVPDDEAEAYACQETNWKQTTKVKEAEAKDEPEPEPTEKKVS